MPVKLLHTRQVLTTAQSRVVMAAKRQRARLPVRTGLPMIPRIRRPQRFAFVTNPADLDPDEVHPYSAHVIIICLALRVLL